MTATDRNTSTQLATAYPAGPPEALFHVGDIAGDMTEAVGEMVSGPWTLGLDGQASAGSLGVLIDNVFGTCILLNRPAGQWGVTTEISIDFCAPMPVGGGPMVARARVQGLGDGSGVSQGTVCAADGRLIAVGLQRVRFGAGVVPTMEPVAFPVPDPSLSLAELLAVRTTPGHSGPALELTTRPMQSNPAGNLHGGISLCLSEMAGLRAVQAEGHLLETGSIHVVYVRPAPIGETLRFESEVLYQGRTLAVAQVSGVRADGKVCSLATVTCHRRS